MKCNRPTISTWKIEIFSMLKNHATQFPVVLVQLLTDRFCWLCCDWIHGYFLVTGVVSILASFLFASSVHKNCRDPHYDQNEHKNNA